MNINIGQPAFGVNLHFFFAPEKGLLKILMLADATNKLEQKLHYFIMKLNLTMFGGKILKKEGRLYIFNNMHLSGKKIRFFFSFE